MGTSRSLAYLHTRVARLLPEFGLEELDASAIRTGNRALTQRISECSTPAGERDFDGIHYLSRYGDEFHNWATFEPATIAPQVPEEIQPDDPDLFDAARRLELALV